MNNYLPKILVNILINYRFSLFLNSPLGYTKQSAGIKYTIDLKSIDYLFHRKDKMIKNS
jgi:hypothetical protein